MQEDIDKIVKKMASLNLALCREHQNEYATAEGYNFEVSPTGKRVKFRFQSGATPWEDADEWLLIEDLGIAPSFVADIRRK